MSYAKRMKAARAAYKKAQTTTAAKLEEGEYQIKIDGTPSFSEPTKGSWEGSLVLTIPLTVAVGPDAGKKLSPKRYQVLDKNNKSGQSLDFLKTDLEKMGLDPEFDFGEAKKVFASMKGMVLDCFVKDGKDPRFQNVYINGPVDALDDLEEEEAVQEEEEVEEVEEIEEAPKKSRRSKGAAAKKKPEAKGIEEEIESDDLVADEEDDSDDEEDWEDDSDDEEDWEDES